MFLSAPLKMKSGTCQPTFTYSRKIDPLEACFLRESISWPFTQEEATWVGTSHGLSQSSLGTLEVTASPCVSVHAHAHTCVHTLTRTHTFMHAHTCSHMHM